MDAGYRTAAIIHHAAAGCRLVSRLLLAVLPEMEFIRTRFLWNSMPLKSLMV
jgi:hypothetical protein